MFNLPLLRSPQILILIIFVYCISILLYSREDFFQIYPRLSDDAVTPFHAHQVHMLYISGVADYDHVMKLLVDEAKGNTDLEFEPIQMILSNSSHTSAWHQKPWFTPLILGNIYYGESSADSYAELIPAVMVMKKHTKDNTQQSMPNVIKCEDELCIFKEMVSSHY